MWWNQPKCPPAGIGITCNNRCSTVLQQWKVCSGNFPLVYERFSSDHRKLCRFVRLFFPPGTLARIFFLYVHLKWPLVASLTQLASCSRASAERKGKEWQPPELTDSHGQQFPAAERGKKYWKHFSQNKLAGFIYMQLGDVINSTLHEKLAFLNFCQHACSIFF